MDTQGTPPPLEPKPIPRETTFQALFEPDLTYDFLAGAARFPFERSVEFSAVNAWWLAELSLLCYVRDRSFIQGVLERAGLTAPVFFEEGGSFAFCVEDFCIFRGTDDISDVLKDLDAVMVLDGAVKVHRGFLRALDLVWDGINDHLGPREAVFAGHSLGGAMATLAAWRRTNTRCAYTYGAPRVGSKGLRESLSVPLQRIVNNNDVVTRLPPPLRYRHAGRLYYIDENGRVLPLPERWGRIKEQVQGHGNRALDNVKRWLGGEFDAIPYDSLIDHSPLHYTLHLWNHLLWTCEPR